jgi:hypothetical protein
MNAQHILSRWERVAPMLRTNDLCYGATGGVKPLTFWLAMIYVARGQTSAPELVQNMGISLSLASGMLRLMHQEGLARRSGRERMFSRPRTLWSPTAKLMDMLALKPVGDVKKEDAA